MIQSFCGPKIWQNVNFGFFCCQSYRTVTAPFFLLPSLMKFEEYFEKLTLDNILLKLPENDSFKPLGCHFNDHFLLSYNPLTTLSQYDILFYMWNYQSCFRAESVLFSVEYLISPSQENQYSSIQVFCFESALFSSPHLVGFQPGNYPII